MTVCYSLQLHLLPFFSISNIKLSDCIIVITLVL
nr:MAG TPA: hypothetical protein [Caudoviricetes sp.]